MSVRMTRMCIPFSKARYSAAVRAIFGAVSYTHLDVYKRQILDRYMKDQPAKRTDNILTPYIKSAIGVSAIFITLGSILILENIGGITSWVIPAGCADPELYEKTFMFAFFIYAIIFNSLNTRSCLLYTSIWGAAGMKTKLCL